MRRTLLTFLCLLFVLPNLAIAADNSVYNRVLQSGVLRCGYVNYEPWFMREPNTNKLSGIFYELTELIGKKLSLKVEWTEETGFGTFVPDLQNNKFDMMCSGGWETPSYAKNSRFSQPAFYMPVYAVVRANDARFDKDLSRVNAPDVKIVTLDGDIAGMIHDENFPRAKLSSLQNMTDFTQVMTEVATHKADVTFADMDAVQRFIVHNPGTIKIVKTKFPVRLYPTSLIYRNDSSEFDNMINSALRELIFSGEVQKILQKYKADPASYLPVSPPTGRGQKD